MDILTEGGPVSSITGQKSLDLIFLQNETYGEPQDRLATVPYMGDCSKLAYYLARLSGAIVYE